MSIAIFLFFILLFYLDVDLYLRLPFKLLLEQWSKLPIIGKNTPQWKDISLIIELYLCAPFSDVTLDGSFSYMTIIKTGSRNCLFSSCLNLLLWIRMSGYSLQELPSKQVRDCEPFTMPVKWYFKILSLNFSDTFISTGYRQISWSLKKIFKDLFCLKMLFSSMLYMSVI